MSTATITTQYITADGETYTITVTYDEDAEIPEGATLSVDEISKSSADYQNYLSKAAAKLDRNVPYARLHS